MITNTPQKITTTTVTTTNRDLSHNIEELDSLLDDLQRDQDRKMYKSMFIKQYVRGGQLKTIRYCSLYSFQ